MIVDRYYYHQLNKQDQAVYRAFYDGVMAHQSVIPIPVSGVFPEDAFERIFDAMTRDNPLIYYLNQSACSCARDMFGRYAICPQYFFSEDKVKEYNRKIEKEVNTLICSLSLIGESDYEKERKIHDWICQNILYDTEGADKKKPVRMIVSHNILGVFAHHKAQCEGIAKAVKVLLNAVDVKCIVVTGESLKNGITTAHAWNLVNIDGNSYHLDVTWDIGARSTDLKRIPYDYFNLNDSLIVKEHQSETKLPVCKSMRDNYFHKYRKVFWRKDQVLCYVEKQLKKGETEIYFRVEGIHKASDMIIFACDQINRFFEVNRLNRKRLKWIVNDEIGTCWIKYY